VWHLFSAQAQMDFMTSEMVAMEKVTCIKFVDRTAEVDFVEITNGNGCYSWLGRIGGRQELSMGSNGCLGPGIMMHEWYHALGFEHMHNHIDRDRYVEVVWENIYDGLEGAFAKVNPQWFDNFDTPYDLLSVLHYQRWAFSKNGQDTLVPRDRRYVDLMGAAGVQSPGDIQRLNNMYECKRP